MSDKTPRRLRLEQSRSVGVILTLSVLLGLVVYNALSGGTAWVSRSDDVRLLMLLLSVFLGVDIAFDSRKAIVELLTLTIRFIGSEMMGNHKTTDDNDRSQTTTDRDSDADHDDDPSEDDATGGG